mgnify:CR=1 FL=1
MWEEIYHEISKKGNGSRTGCGYDGFDAHRLRRWWRRWKRRLQQRFFQLEQQLFQQLQQQFFLIRSYFSEDRSSI